jgi:hypothetical protein
VIWDAMARGFLVSRGIPDLAQHFLRILKVDSDVGKLASSLWIYILV